MTTIEAQVIEETSLAVADRRDVALRTAIEVWAASSTSGTTRRREELIAKKRKVVVSFFADVGRDPGEVTPVDVQQWCDRMRREDGHRPAAATIYARVSFLSSFYAWAQRELGLRTNPALLARPKAPKPYQTESTKSWTDEELRRITSVVVARAAGGDLVGKRDLALLLMYTSTGLRREEVIGLRGRDVQITEEGFIIGGRVKGGRYRAREVRDQDTKAALLDYLTTAKRLHVLKTENKSLDQRVARLQDDAEIERLAREQYGLVKPGEEAYAILPSPSPAPPPTPAKKASANRNWAERLWHSVF